MLLSSMADEMLSGPPGNHHVIAICDEFPRMGKVEVFQTLFSMGAGHGVAMIPIAQSVGQMIDAYGHEGWNEIKAGCELVLYLTPITDERTEMEVIRLAGKRTVSTMNFSRSGGS